MSGPKLIAPKCPLTGLPATRLIQPVSARLIEGLWRHPFGVSVDRQLDGVARFGLWEAPSGLVFFDPMIEGDQTFYRDLYRDGRFHRVLSAPGLGRGEFRRAAELVRPGESLLDVGCGDGALAQYLPDVVYTGIDPHFAAVDPAVDVRQETAAAHSAAHPGQYDAVCAFHVIEHLSDPLACARDWANCVKPGGRLLVAVPRWPSPFTEIPNFVFNAPPHHLSWWNENALHTLSDRLGFEVEELKVVPFSTHDSIVYWMARLAPKLVGKRYFRAHWTWYLALGWSGLAGRIADILLRVPVNAAPAGLLLVARKPG
jgi:SAM-dependent methyltransferase